MSCAALLLVLSPLAAHAAPRTWRSADGGRSFIGTYIRHDQSMVTVRRGGRSLTFSRDKLHSDDQTWLNQQSGAAPTTNDPTKPDESVVFDTLRLGDSHADVRSYLDESDFVELIVARTFLGRFGLNGTYRTCQAIGGHHCLLFFDWTMPEDEAEDRRMRELSLQTEPGSQATYPASMRKTWTEFANLLSKLHGKPLQSADYPPLSELTTDGMFLGSHLWRLENNHSAVLGTARDQGKFSVVVRFTTETIQPIKTGPVKTAQNAGDSLGTPR